MNLSENRFSSRSPQWWTISSISFPTRRVLTPAERRGIIARYSAVLEGNFIYWMTAASIAVKSEEVREILGENLFEEVRDAHPLMLRKFAIAAHAFPTDTDALAADAELTAVRLFLGKLQGVQSVLTMAFFEGWIQRFMAYLADLAKRQGSTEMVYTDVHGVCDVTHTAELFRALVVGDGDEPDWPGCGPFRGRGYFAQPDCCDRPGSDHPGCGINRFTQKFQRSRALREQDVAVTNQLHENDKRKGARWILPSFRRAPLYRAARSGGACGAGAAGGAVCLGAA